MTLTYKQLLNVRQNVQRDQAGQEASNDERETITRNTCRVCGNVWDGSYPACSKCLERYSKEKDHSNSKRILDVKRETIEV